MTERIRLPLLLAALLMTSSALASQSWQIVEQRADRTVIELQLDDWTHSDVAGGVVHHPAGASLDARPGGRITPFLYKLIALPSEELPRVILEEQVWGEQSLPLAPRGDDTLSTLTVDQMEGRGPAFIAEPHEFRRRHAAWLYIVPVRQQGNRLQALKRLRLRLEHPKAGSSLTSERDPLIERFALNGTAARHMAQPRPASHGRRLARQGSSFPSGTLIRLEIEQEGIYQITYGDLVSRGIDLAGVDPRSLRLYGNGGQVLPESPELPRDSALIENAIHVIGEADGSFDSADRILFYGRAVNSFLPSAIPGEYRHNVTGDNNPFTNRNVYWLVVPDDGQPGKRMAPLASEQTPTYTAEVARSRSFVDNDVFIYNRANAAFIVESGKEWWAARIAAGNEYRANVQVNQPLTEARGKLWLSYRHMRLNSDRAVLRINDSVIDTFSFTASTRSFQLPDGLLREGSNSIAIEVLSGELLFDWLEISYDRRLTTSSGRLDFDQFREDGVATVSLGGLEEPWIFDVHAFDDVRYTRQNPYAMPTTVNAPHRSIAVEDGLFLRPPLISLWGSGGPEYPAGLRDPSLAADYIMVVHDDFFASAAALESYIEQRDTIDVIRVKTSDIYDEFGWGLFDPTAIRDFLRYSYERWARLPQTVLFVGDGDYDYRNIVSDNDDNWVPPYENYSDSRDDWFVTFQGNDSQMVIGRLPVQSSSELEVYIDKLDRYENESDLGAWRSRVVMVADDEYVETGPRNGEDAHMRQAENFAKNIAPAYMDIEKIYIGTYPTVYDAATGGRRKPLANRDLIDVLNEGALLVNYLGHGNAHVWAHEHVLLDSRDGPLIDSGNRVPLYVAATCSWAHFDRPDNEAHPEQLVGQPGGAIGVIAATRKTTGGANNNFISALYAQLFDRAAALSIGECLMLAKNGPAGGGTSRYYHVLGEPNLRLAIPNLNMTADQINPDSLTALSTAQVNGRVQDHQGNAMPGFDGEAVISVFDGADTLSYDFLGTNGSVISSLDYSVTGGTLFRGRASTVGGGFATQFIVPRDVKYGSAAGRIRMYAYNEQQDAIGVRDTIPIATSSASLDDATPPEIAVHFDHRRWRSGDMTRPNPTLIVEVFDTNGVNLTGEIGHEIRAIIDGEDEIVLTGEFFYDRDSYTRGSAEQRLLDLKPGPHSIEVWAWDNANNFARSTADFVVTAEGSELALANVLNWPNPFREQTGFTFELSTEAEVAVRIFTASGRLVRELGPVQAVAGFNYPEGNASALSWDGRDRHGDPVANGVYLYRITARAADGSSTDALGKLMRVR